MVKMAVIAFSSGGPLSC